MAGGDRVWCGAREGMVRVLVSGKACNIAGIIAERYLVSSYQSHNARRGEAAYTGRIVAICHLVMVEIVDVRVGSWAREKSTLIYEGTAGRSAGYPLGPIKPAA